METGKVQVKKELDWKLPVLIVLVLVVLIPVLSKVPKVEKAIDAIGTVTLDSEEVIAQAEEAYAALKPEQQAKVENYAVLVAARAEYECQVVEEAIGSIGKVTLDSEGAISHAEELFDALSGQDQQNVDNRNDLEKARRYYDRMVSAVQTARDAIDAIGTVTLQSGKLIKDARSAVDELSVLENSTGAQLVSALGDKMTVLTDAEAAYEACVVEYQYGQAMDLFNSKDYTQALSAFRDLISQYPGSAKVKDAKDQAFQCVLKLAEDAHNKGDQYTAMQMLKAEKDYASSDGYKTLMDKIVKRLTGSRPSNGAKMSDKIAWGWCELRVTADDKDICVKVVSKTDKSKVTMFYVRKGETASAKLENGSYHVYYTEGEYWFDKDHGFGDDATYGKAKNGLSLDSWISGNMVYYYRYDLDFSNTFNNDISTTSATSAEFWG